MSNADIHETFDYGYDPAVAEDLPLVPVPKPATSPPPQWNVTSSLLPPVGKQTTPSCFVWSTTYGCVTFAAARYNKCAPTLPAGQASPVYTYIKVQEQQNVPSGTCSGGVMSWPLQYLRLNGGTASMATAPAGQACSDAWTSWGSATTSPNAQFQPLEWSGVSLTGSAGLDNMRAIIFGNTPIAYGTWLYTDFPPYAGTPSPYVGNGTWLINKTTGKKAGHCMMIIGYDDTMEAVLIQNSFGTSWGTQWNGSGGYVWMSYTTFQATMQGGGLYITKMQSGANP